MPPTDVERLTRLHAEKQKIDAEMNYLERGRSPKMPDQGCDIAMGIASQRPMSTEEIIDQLFTYHPPTDEAQILKYQIVRDAGKALALAVWRNCPYGADRTAAIRQIREAVMTANASIALNGLSFS